MRGKHDKKSYMLSPWLIAVAAILLFIAGTVAIYKNQGYKKGVAFTGQAEVMFSSSLLRQINQSDIINSEKYSDNSEYKSDVTVVTNADKVEFSFDVYNYAPNNPSNVNSKDITYDLEVTLKSEGSSIVKFSVNGTASANNICKIEGNLLKGKSVATNPFKIAIPQTALSQGIKLDIRAIPNDASSGAVNNRVLGIIATPIQPSGEGTVVTGWSGDWTEKSINGLSPSACSAFNYEISGTGAGTITLTWPDALRIDPVFVEKWSLVVSSNNNSSSTSFMVNANNGASAYAIRFYRTEKELPYNGTSFANWLKIDSFTAQEES